MLVALAAGKALTAAELDAKCEKFLERAFSLRLDFKMDSSLPSLLDWGLAAREADGRIRAVPVEQALCALDAVWDGLFSYEVSTGRLSSCVSCAHLFKLKWAWERVAS